jgi:sRNA-binding regulator protein Hfq
LGNGSIQKATVPQGTASSRRKIAPPEQTNAESYYYLKQMQSKTPMVVVLRDGERIRGIIEWYDKHCLKVNRVKEPNLLLPKHSIKYLYKQEEEPKVRRARGGAREEGASDHTDAEAQRYE